MSQWLRVKRALDKAGARGITRVDFLPPTMDGGPPILNMPGRIYDLKQQEYDITTFGERDGCDVYLYARYLASDLVAERQDDAGGAQNPDVRVITTPASLFDVPPVPRSAIYDEEAA